MVTNNVELKIFTVIFVALSQIVWAQTATPDVLDFDSGKQTFELPERGARVWREVEDDDSKPGVEYTTDIDPGSLHQGWCEGRIWDEEDNDEHINTTSNTWNFDPPSVDAYIQFCFTFTPNQGKVCKIRGTAKLDAKFVARINAGPGAAAAGYDGRSKVQYCGLVLLVDDDDYGHVNSTSSVITCGISIKGFTISNIPLMEITGDGPWEATGEIDQNDEGVPAEGSYAQVALESAGDSFLRLESNSRGFTKWHCDPGAMLIVTQESE